MLGMFFSIIIDWLNIFYEWILMECRVYMWCSCSFLR